MTKAEFLVELDRSLTGFTTAERRDILADYEEHFRMGAAEGKSEEAISASLGNPRVIARSFLAEHLVDQAGADRSPGNILRAVLAVISLSFFNLVVVLGPFVGLVGALVGLWAAGVSVTVAGVAVFFAGLLGPVLPFWVHLPGGPAGWFGTWLVGLGLASLGLLGCIGLYYLTIWLYRLMVAYLKFNLRIIKG